MKNCACNSRALHSHDRELFTQQSAIYPKVSEETRLRQDGVTCRTKRITISTVKHLLPHHVITSNRDGPRSASLPKLMACYLLLWGYIKIKVFNASPPQNIPEFKNRIQEAAHTPVQVCAVKWTTCAPYYKTVYRYYIQDMRHVKKSAVGNEPNTLICASKLSVWNSPNKSV